MMRILGAVPARSPEGVGDVRKDRAPAVSRRQVIGGLAGLLAAACGGQAGMRVPSASSASSPLLLYIRGATSGAAMSGFGAFDPEVDPVDDSQYGTLVSEGVVPAWVVGYSWAYESAASWYAPLDAAIRQVNFDRSVLLPGVAEAFTDHGTPYGMPGAMVAGALRYRVDAFAQLGLAPPAAQWSIGDFERVCAALQGALDRQALPGYRAVLAPIDAPQLVLGGFVVGHGGSYVHDGAFDLTGAGTVTGIGRYLDIWRAYAAHTPPAMVGLDTRAQGALLQFLDYPPTKLDMTGWRWARFPRMPARPVVPATATGWQLTHERRSSNGVPDWTAPLPGVSVPDAATRAVVRYALWRYGQMEAAPAQETTPPPLASAEVQQAFWQAAEQRAPGARSVGDWANYALVGADQPLTVVDAATRIQAAVVSVVEDGTDLRAALLVATHRLNADATSLAAQRAGASEAAVQRSAASAAFPVAGS